MEADAETRTVYRIASHLSKSVAEVLDLPAEEVRGWVAYLSTLSKPNI
ncbi:MAG: hypothetical protein AAFY65_13290 [Pseudomonadota bacterium]